MQREEGQTRDDPVYPDLEGQCAVVVGGAGGLGASAALTLAKSGCRVAILDLLEKHESAKMVVQRLQEAGAVAADFRCDVLSIGSLEAALAEVNSDLGAPRILVNSAGIVVRKPALETTESDWDTVVDVCLKGTFFASQVAARYMLDAGGGSIINISSVFGSVGGQNRVAYAASKAGVGNLTRVLALEWHGYGIRVNAVAPSFVRTPMTEALLNEGLDVVNKSVTRPLAELEDVSAAIVFLASDAASGMITGHSIPVDGGWTIW